MQIPEPPAPLDVAVSEQDEHTRNRLLRAAVNIFDRKGYAAASVREIAESAGVAKPALYYHFGSKEGLLVAILRTAIREFVDTTNRAMERSGTAVERVIAMCDDIYGLFVQTVPIVRVAHTVLLGPRDAAPPFDPTESERHARKLLRALVEDGKTTGEIRQDVSSDDVALAIMGVLEGCWGRQLHPAFEPIDIDTLRRTVKLVFEGALNERRAQGEQTQ
jgi:TetR/AcrR family transcriptional regulator